MGGRIPWKGLFRLWVVASIVVVPILAFKLAQPDLDTWRQIDTHAIQLCVDEETGSTTYAQTQACIHRLGADQTPFQHEHTTPGVYWCEALALGFVCDLFITGFIVGIVAVALWVKRGFAR